MVVELSLEGIRRQLPPSIAQYSRKNQTRQRKKSRVSQRRPAEGKSKYFFSKGNSAMPVYMIADIKVTDNKWVPAYAASVHDLVHKHGGKYLSRSGNVKTLEGKPLDTSLIAILQFPSGQAVSAFLADPKYAPFAAARKDGSESRFQLIDDTDLAGTISYLPKG
jgi:uncharacterized protein (DUF1330 family)